MPIDKCFDFMVGCSTGGIICMGLGTRSWSIEQCIEKFESVASNVFTKRTVSTIPLLGTILNGIITAFTGHRYDKALLEATLQREFGEERLFGVSGSKKIAVTACTADGRPCILTSYNGEMEHYQGMSDMSSMR
jgi:patatin-like phospholipase/acyl hydrolase